MSRVAPFQLVGRGVVPCSRGRQAVRPGLGSWASSSHGSFVLRSTLAYRRAGGVGRCSARLSSVFPPDQWRLALVWANPSIERTCPGKPGHAAHVERYVPSH